MGMAPIVGVANHTICRAVTRQDGQNKYTVLVDGVPSTKWLDIFPTTPVFNPDTRVVTCGCGRDVFSYPPNSSLFA